MIVPITAVLDVISLLDLELDPIACFTWHVDIDLAHAFFPVPIEKRDQRQFTITEDRKF